MQDDVVECFFIQFLKYKHRFFRIGIGPRITSVWVI